MTEKRNSILFLSLVTTPEREISTDIEKKKTTFKNPFPFNET